MNKLEEQIRESEAESLEKYRLGTEDAPVIYRPSGYFKEIVKANGEDLMQFVANEESEDRHGDIVTAEGWQLKNFKTNPVIMFAHNYSIPPVGTAPSVTVEGKQLLNTVSFDMQDPFAAFLQGKYARKVMRAESVGFRPLEFEPRKKDSQDFFPSFLFTKQELMEISLVPIPAHPRALAKMLENKTFMMINPIDLTGDVTTTTSNSNNITFTTADPEPDPPTPTLESIHETLTKAVDMMEKLAPTPVTPTPDPDPTPQPTPEPEIMPDDVEKLRQAIRSIKEN